MDADGFKLVTKSKKRSKGVRKDEEALKKLADLHRSLPIERVDPEKLLKKLDVACQELKESRYFSDLCKKTILKDIKSIVCLGIGNFSDSVQARYQFALLDCLVEYLKIGKDQVKIFDPRLTDSEVDFATKHLGFIGTSNSTKDNLEGRYKAAKKTLVFMPHCPKQLTNNLIYENWNPTNLQNLVIICNSFDRLANSQPERILLEQGVSLILKVRSLCQEVDLENNFRLSDIFNDLSLHTFKVKDNFKDPSDSFWSDVQAPIYPSEDLEFVKQK